MSLTEDKLWWAHYLDRRGRFRWLPILAKDWYLARAQTGNRLVPLSTNEWLKFYAEANISPRR